MLAGRVGEQRLVGRARHERGQPGEAQTVGPGREAAAEVPERLWLRSERQTLRALPESGSVLFTIRVQQTPFGALAQRPQVASALADRLRAQPAELTAMNGLTLHHQAVLTWLDGLAP